MGVLDVPPKGPNWLVPPAAFGASNTAEAVWYSAARFISMRFTIQAPVAFTRARLGCGAASGNIEIAIGSAVQTSTDVFTINKLFTTGSIACPSPVSSSISPTFTSTAALTPGHYVAMLWCDNTTATFSHYLSNAVLRAGLSLGDAGAGNSASGIPNSFSGVTPAGRAVMMALQGA